MNPLDADTRLGRRPLLLAGLALAASAIARAETGKALRIVVPFTPGGSPDILARLLSARLGPALGQAIVVENKAGAGGSLGASEVAHAAADGSTLLMGHTGTLAVNPWLYPKLGYDPVKSFVPVAMVARVPNVLVVKSSASAKSLGQFIEQARAQPGRMSYASGGNGSAAHIAMEYLKLKAGFPMPHVPYRGTAPSVNDVLGGHVDATFTGVPALLPHIRAGSLRALAVSSGQRLASLPEVPTVAESGYPGFDADQWYGLVAPTGLPAGLVDKLNAEVNRALAMPEVIAQMADSGAIPAPTTPAAFGALIVREIPRWGEVVNAADVKAD
jgi:tripartite-type tricarboxylate transporter receptor subunit TctC